jgi:hypothetical protein
MIRGSRSRCSSPTTAVPPALLQRAERAYHQRSTAMIDALADHGISAQGRTGLYVWIPVARELPAIQALLDAGWAATPGEQFPLRTRPAIRLAIATLPQEDTRQDAQDAHAIATTRVSSRRTRHPKVHRERDRELLERRRVVQTQVDP